MLATAFLIATFWANYGAPCTIWTAYVNSSVHFFLQTCSSDNAGTYTVVKLWTCLLGYQTNFTDKKNINFGTKHEIKSVVGRLQLPVFVHFTIKLFVRNFWEMKLDHRLKVNITFLYFDIGYEKAVASRKPFKNRVFLDDTEAFIITRLQCSRAGTYQADCQDAALFFYGRRTKFTIVPKFHSIFLATQTFPLGEWKLDILFSVIDKSMFTDFHYKSHSVRAVGGINPTKCNVRTKKLALSLHNCLYQYSFNGSKRLNSYHIVTKKIFKVKLSLSGWNVAEHITLHDGPDEQAPPVKIHKNPTLENYTFTMSTFQCYLVFSWNIKTTPKLTIVVLPARPVVHNVRINGTLHFSMDNLQISSNKHHHIFHVHTDNGYLNLSLLYLDYNGPNILDCFRGGVVFFQRAHIYSKGRLKLSYIEQVTLCENYTKTPRKHTFDKVPMDYVTSTSSMLLVIYNYVPHNTNMQMLIKISTTPCRGAFPCSKGNNLCVCILAGKSKSCCRS